MNINRHRPKTLLMQCLPDGSTGKLWAVAVFACFAVWALFLLVLSRRESYGFEGLVVLIGAAALAGIAYGSLVTATVLLARAAFKFLGDTVPLKLSPARTVRVAALAYVVHLAALGVLSALGMCKHDSPWYFGLLPMLWQ